MEAGLGAANDLASSKTLARQACPEMLPHRTLKPAHTLVKNATLLVPRALRRFDRRMSAAALLLAAAALLTQLTTPQRYIRKHRTPRRDTLHPSVVNHRGMASPDGRYRATTKSDESSETTHLTDAATGRRLTIGEVARLWRDDEFAKWFQSLLASSAFDAFFWEVPPVNIVTFVETPYEHTLVQNRWGFREADASDFAQHLEGACSRGDRCAAFPNLGRDSMLVSPCDEGGPPPIQPRAHGTLYERANPHPAVEESAYGHVAAFARNAPETQATAFWAKVGATYEALVAQKGDRPVWLSTEGSGVPWLHVRLDSTPKYYHHTPFARGDV